MMAPEAIRAGWAAAYAASPPAERFLELAVAGGPVELGEGVEELGVADVVGH